MRFYWTLDIMNRMRMSELFWLLVISLLLLLPACGGGAPDISGKKQSYVVGGSVSNLLFDGLVLQNNGADDLVISANTTSFTFATAMADGQGYDVTVKTQPEMQLCMITQASGTVFNGDVRNVGVQCFVPLSIVIRGE